MVAAAGRDVLRVLTIEKDDTLKARVNLRVGIRRNLDLSCNDVQWHCRKKSIIATAATNGTIVVWNLERPGHQRKMMQFKGKRAVNRLSWSSTNDDHLLSGAQEATVKLWDIRTNGRPTTYRHRRVRSVHEVIFQPNCADNSSRFAVGLDNGSIAIWDARSNKEPAIEWKNAHHGIVLTLDWHTRGKLLASGGRDCMIKVWDSDRLAAPRHKIRTTATVGRVKWRPGSRGQIASCASVFDCDVSLWSLDRANYPIAICQGHRDAASGIAFVESGDVTSAANVLVSCSKDGSVALHSIARAYMPVQNMRTAALTFSPGESLALVNRLVERKSVAPSVVSGRGAGGKLHSNVSVRVKSAPSLAISDDGSTSRASYPAPFVWNSAAKYIATNYHLQGISITRLSRHNADVARTVGASEVETTWLFLAELYEDEPSTDNGTILGDTEGARDVLGLTRFREQIVTDIVRTSVDNGDIQTAVAVLACVESNGGVRRRAGPLIRKEVDKKEDRADEEKQRRNIDADDDKRVEGEEISTLWSHKERQQWIASYIELLQRAQLEVEAAEIRKLCLDDDIAGMTRRETSFNLRCTKCRSAVDSNRVCRSCGSFALSICSICKLPVTSLGLACRNCGHGGHFGCLRAWFSKSKVCPSGCGHVCGR
eukprot:g1044.t1